MKTLIFAILLCLLVYFAGFSKGLTRDVVKSDTIRDIKNQPKPKVVKGKNARIRLQLHQIAVHEKQMKKVHKADREVQKAEQEQH